MPIITRKLHTKYELNTTLDKGVIEVSFWLPKQLNLGGTLNVEVIGMLVGNCFGKP